MQLTEKRQLLVLDGQPSPSYSAPLKKIAKLSLAPASDLLSRLSQPHFQLIQPLNPPGKAYYSAAANKISIVKQSRQISLSQLPKASVQLAQAGLSLTQLNPSPQLVILFNLISSYFVLFYLVLFCSILGREYSQIQYLQIKTTPQIQYLHIKTMPQIQLIFCQAYFFPCLTEFHLCMHLEP